MNKIKEIYDYREMIFSLVRRELRGRYKGSVLGFLWTFINPLLQLVIYTMVFSMIMKNNIENYYLFLFVALIPWNFFSSCLSGGSRAILNQQNLVTKIYFPREVLPISFVTSGFVNMLYCFVVVIIVVIISGVGINPLAFPILPLVMIIEYALALGITLIASAITVYFRDMEHILTVLTLAWIHLTPVMYPLDAVPENIRIIFEVNPMTPIIIAYRDILYYCKIPDLASLGSTGLISLVILVIGFAIFGLLQRRFAEEM